MKNGKLQYWEKRVLYYKNNMLHPKKSEVFSMGKGWGEEGEGRSKKNYCITKWKLPQTAFNLREELHVISSLCDSAGMQSQGHEFLNFKGARNRFQRVNSASQWSLVGLYRAGNFKESMGARNRRGIGLSYRPARLHRLAEFIPWN